MRCIVCRNILPFTGFVVPKWVETIFIVVYECSWITFYRFLEITYLLNKYRLRIYDNTTKIWNNDYKLWNVFAHLLFGLYKGNTVIFLPTQNKEEIINSIRRLLFLMYFHWLLSNGCTDLNDFNCIVHKMLHLCFVEYANWFRNFVWNLQSSQNEPFCHFHSYFHFEYMILLT